MTNTFYKTLCLITLLPFLSACLEKERLAKIPDAENQLFLSDGRLLVTGDTGIHQIIRQGEAYQAQTVASEVANCQYTGLAQREDWVFTACREVKGWLFNRSHDNHLLAARVVAGQPLRFTQVRRPAPDPMDLLEQPRGMAISPVGDLLIADDRKDGTVFWFQLDLSSGTPEIHRAERNWLGATHGISRPKGLKVKGNELFLSEHNSVKRFVMNPLGNVPQQIMGTQGQMVKNEVVLYRNALSGPLGDIQPHCGGVIISQTLEGRLLYAAPNGTDAHGLPRYRILHETWHQSLQQPTSVQIGQGPDFNGFDVLVTERGTNGDHITSYGNRLTRVKLTVDLHDPLVCEVLNEG